MQAAFSPSRDWSGLRRRLSELLCVQDITPAQKTDGYLLLRRIENEELSERLTGKGLRPEYFDSSEFALNLWEASKEVCPFSSACLFTESLAQSLAVYADRAAFARVLLHLVCNCFLYAGHSPFIKFTVSRKKNSAFFLLQDLGAGISPLIQSDLFKTGSGLWLTRTFASCSGGVFLLESRPGKGVSVSFSLPLCSAGPLPAEPKPGELLQNAFSPVFVQLSPRCILPDL